MQSLTDPLNPRLGLATLGVVVASALFGIVPVFARSLTDAGMAAHAVAFYRYVLAVAVLMPVVWHWRHLPRTLAWGAFVGVVMGLGWVGYVRAIEVVPVSTAGVLYMTYPAFALVFSWALFGDRPSGRGIIASLMIVAAAALVSRPGAVPPEHVPALILSLAAPAGFGLGISVLVHRLIDIPVLARIGVVSAGSVIGLAPLMLATPLEAIVPASANGWLMVVGIGLGTALIPQLIYTFCSPLIGTARTAMAGSIELPVMFAVGWFFFNESLYAAQGIALILVIAAIGITPAKRARSIAAPLKPGD